MTLKPWLPGTVSDVPYRSILHSSTSPCAVYCLVLTCAALYRRDPLPYFLDKYNKGDYMVSLDPMTTKNPLGDDGPETGITAHHYMNTGARSRHYGCAAHYYVNTGAQLPGA